jgi:hypothetical protein
MVCDIGRINCCQWCNKRRTVDGFKRYSSPGKTGYCVHFSDEKVTKQKNRITQLSE